MFWTNFPVYVQAVTAILTLFIVIATFNTQQKIKTLTDVVVELHKQTKLLSERFEFEKALTIRSRFPDFEVTNFSPLMQENTFRIELMNRGQYATHFHIKNKSDSIETIKIGDYRDIGESKILRLFLTPDPPQTQIMQANFIFTLAYKTGAGHLLEQNIICKDGHVVIVPQKEPNSYEF